MSSKLDWVYAFLEDLESGKDDEAEELEAITTCLNDLVALGYVEVLEDGTKDPLYRLTAEGIEYVKKLSS